MITTLLLLSGCIEFPLDIPTTLAATPTPTAPPTPYGELRYKNDIRRSEYLSAGIYSNETIALLAFGDEMGVLLTVHTLFEVGDTSDQWDLWEETEYEWPRNDILLATNEGERWGTYSLDGDVDVWVALDQLDHENQRLSLSFEGTFWAQASDGPTAETKDFSGTFTDVNFYYSD